MINATPLADTSALTPVSRETSQRVVRCEVVAVDRDSRHAHDLLPWADPYIASLMAKLQREELEG